MLNLTLEDPRSPAASVLIAALTAEISAIYPGDDGTAHFSPEDAMPPGGGFVVARLGEDAVGCGALRPFGAPGVAEIKRMYVAPRVRGQRVGQRILEQLEALARQLGYHTIRLETGTLQPASVRLYERAGYTPIPCYPPYVGCELCLCYEKCLISPNEPVC
jgi:putative acetyltransferase